MIHPDKHIRLDRAIKRLLGDKANFGIIKGLLTTLLLNRQIHIRPLHATPQATERVAKPLHKTVSAG